MISGRYASVREASLEMLGTLMKLVGEKIFIPFLGEIDKIKEAKVRDYFEKAEVSVATKAPKPKSKPAPKPPVALPSISSPPPPSAEDSKSGPSDVVVNFSVLHYARGSSKHQHGLPLRRRQLDRTNLQLCADSYSRQVGPSGSKAQACNS